jgi:hypothetical protein
LLAGRLGVAFNCIVRYSGIGPSKKDIEDLGKLYLEKAIDNEKIEKKIAGIQKSLDDHKKAMDMLTSPLKAAADYLGKNHAFFFK